MAESKFSLRLAAHDAYSSTFGDFKKKAGALEQGIKSQRAGSYVTLRDLIEWTSTDAVRFFLLSRKPDTEYTFDVDLAVTKNNDNPVYYVQYAHARICSVLASWGGDVASLHDVELTALESPAAQALMLPNVRMFFGRNPQA